MTNIEDNSYKNSAIEIPADLKPILKDITIRKNLLVLILGSDYNGRRVLETIKEDWTKFKKIISSNLKEKTVESEDITKIINLIQDNYEKIYPDNEGHQGSPDQYQTEDSDSDRPKIEYDKWQSVLHEKYMDVKKICDKNFPGIWHSIEFELSVLKILNLKGCSLPFAGIILGMPSSLKTLGIELLRDCKNVYYTNNFSAKAFVSHTTSVPKDQLSEIDLLPRIKNKCMLASELSSVFSKKDEDLIETLGTLIVILDGNGYESDSGVHGKRGYYGKYMFTIIGAAVDISYKVYKHLTNLGPKLYFLRMPKSHKTDDDFIYMLESDDFNERKNELREKLNDYFDWFDKFCPFEIDEETKLIKIPVDMKREDTKNIIQIIVRLGKLLARLRGNVTTFYTEKTQGSNYGYSTPTTEEPDRAMTQLRNLAKAHAISQGRTYLNMDDIPLLIKVVLSTASRERTMIFDLILAGDGNLTTSQIVRSLNIAPSTALRTMAELKALELVSANFGNDEEYLYDGMPRYANEQYKITLHPDFKWFLSDEFKSLRQGFVPKGESKYTRDNNSIKKNSPPIQQKIPDVNIYPDTNMRVKKELFLSQTPQQREITTQTMETAEHNRELSETNNSLEFDVYTEDKKLRKSEEYIEGIPLNSDEFLNESNRKEIISKVNHFQNDNDNIHTTKAIHPDDITGHNEDGLPSKSLADTPHYYTSQLSKDTLYTVLLQQIIKNSLTRGKIS